MTIFNAQEITSLLRDDDGVSNVGEKEAFFTNGMSPNLSEMIGRVGSGGDFTASELAVFKEQAENFAASYQ